MNDGCRSIAEHYIVTFERKISLANGAVECEFLRDSFF